MLLTRNIFIYLTSLTFLLSVQFVSGAQEPDRSLRLKSLIEKGDSLRIAYRFDESLDAYEEALEMTGAESSVPEDSLLRFSVQDRILMSENGRSMMGFVDTPNVVAKRKFAIDEFFLYYPLQDSSWRDVPNQLDSSADHRFVRASYISHNIYIFS